MNEYMSKKALESLGSPDSDDVLLREALAIFLAKFLANDKNEGGAIITNFLKDKSEKYEKQAGRGANISGILIAVSILSFLLFAQYQELYPKAANVLFGIWLLSLLCAGVPRLQTQHFQYGWTRSEAPSDLPHANDEHINAFLAFFQKEFGVKAYYFSRWKKKRVILERRQFFGKLRCFLFSEHGEIRRLVLRFPTAMASPLDIFLRRSDLEKMIEDSKLEPESESEPKPKRQAGPGRTPSSRYADALIALLGDQNLLKIDTDDAEAANREIKKTLNDWFKANKDETEWVPKSNQIETYVEKIYAHLKNLAACR
jgi:hypothetical protein